MNSFGMQIPQVYTHQKQGTSLLVSTLCSVIWFGVVKSFGSLIVHRRRDYLCGMFWKTKYQPGTIFKKGTSMGQDGVLCKSEEETIPHLFLNCIYIKEVWVECSRLVGLSCMEWRNARIVLEKLVFKYFSL